MGSPSGSYDSDADKSTLGLEVTSGALSAGVGAVLPHPLGALVASASYPFLLRLMRNVAEEWRGIREARAVRVFDVACEETGLSANELAIRLSENVPLIELAGAAANAAAGSTYDARIVALGKALATGVLADDMAIVDRERFFVSALAELDAVHVRVLALGAQVNEDIPSLEDRLLSEQDDELNHVFGPVRATLSRLGLVWSRPEITMVEPPSHRYALEPPPKAPRAVGQITQLTRFGREVLHRLETIGIGAVLDDDREQGGEDSAPAPPAGAVPPEPAS